MFRLPGHRRLPGLGRRVGRACVVTLWLTVGIACLVLVTQGDRSVQAPPAWTTAVQPRSAAVARLMERFECSVEGFGTEDQPRSAIVREPQGGFRVVGFDRGWHVHRTDPGALVAVCLAPPR